jgi:hypothetical protein
MTWPNAPNMAKAKVKMIIVTSALAGTGIKASFGQLFLCVDTSGSLMQYTSPTYLLGNFHF